MKKRSGKGARIKGVFIFLLLLAAAGAIFYFGYYQFQLPTDTYGVIFTKISGWNPTAVKPGEFRIEWEGLVPGNLNIQKFVLKPRETLITAEGRLPSAETYKMYLEGNPDFSYKYTFSASYSLKPEYLPELVVSDFLRADTLSSWYEDIESRIIKDAISYIKTKAADDAYMKGISYNFRLMEDDLKEKLASEYEAVNFIRFSPVAVEIPDPKLYAEGRDQYLSMIKFMNELEREAQRQISEIVVKETSKITILEKYGEVFHKYPELLDYYALFGPEFKSLPEIELPDVSE
jgi:hypothetical protein